MCFVVGRNFPARSKEWLDVEEAVGMARGAMTGRASEDEVDDVLVGEAEEDVSGVDVEVRSDDETLDI